MDNFRALPQMTDALETMIAKGKARLATVVKAYNNEVDAQLSDGSVARFASMYNGLSAGQKGMLISAFGDKKIFVPLGIPLEPVPPVTIRAVQTIGASISSTSISGNPDVAVQATITLPKGQWELEFLASGTLWRSVNSGARIFGTSVDGVWGGIWHDLDLPATRTTPVDRTISIGTVLNIPSERNVTIQYGFRGGSTAGTTYCSNAVIHGTARMIGEL